MKEDFILPDIGEGIVECELVEWLVKVGDVVHEDQPVADVQTDKALVQIPAKHGGRIEKLYVSEGELAKVHAPLFQIDIENLSAQNDETIIEPVIDSEEPVIALEEQVSERPTQPLESIASPSITSEKVLATPAVRRIAREKAIDLASVQGTGPNGRILKQDLLSLSAAEQPTETSARRSIETSDATVDVIPIKGIRAIMAEQMKRSVSTIPHFTYAEEIDLSQSVALRRELNSALPDDNRLTLMAFFIKSLSIAIQKFPILNAHVNEAGTEIHQFSEHNIGMAVDSPIGLLVPNIKSVNRLSLSEVAAEVRRLTELGRAGRIPAADMKGGTITISNIGAIGGTVTTPIINAPEVAIVGIGRIQSLPRPDADGNLVLRDIVQVSWSGDHRVLDGGTIAHFNNAWKSLLESPQQMLLALR